MRDELNSQTARPAPSSSSGELLVVLTPPSVLSAAVLHAIRSLAERALGPVDMLKLSTIEALRSGMIARKTRHLLLYSDCPAPAAIQLIKQTLPPVLIVADDPVRVAQSLRSKIGHEPLAAVRTTTLSFATLHDLVLGSARRKVLAPHDVASVADYLRQAAEFFSLSVTPADLAAVVDRFSAQDEWEAARAEAATTIAPGGGIVSPFRSIYEIKPADKFYWPPALFFGTEPLGSPLQEKIDLTGPARPILYGPYMHLPTGVWDVVIRFTISENRSGNALLIEWLAANDIKQSAKVSTLPEAGKFQGALQVEVTDPRDPLQLRISILEGAIEGIFEFHGAEVSRQTTS